MELGYSIKTGEDGCRIAPLDTTVDYDHIEFDLVYKCTECGHSDHIAEADKLPYLKFIQEKQKTYPEFLEKKDELKKGLTRDFTMALKEMKPEDIRKLSWFVRSYREV